MSEGSGSEAGPKLLKYGSLKASKGGLLAYLGEDPR